MIALCLLLAWTQDRLPEPAAAVQKETRAAVRDLFKEDYAKKSPADQQALARKLLAKGVETADDPPGRYVLLQEAREIAAAAGDLGTAFQAADEAAKAFAVDGYALRVAAVGMLVPGLRDPDRARLCVRALLETAENAARAEAFEAAEDAVSKTPPLVRIAQDPILAARAAELKRDVASLKSEAGRIKRLLENPKTGDAEALGRWFCLAKADWETGLPHLIAGAKAPLKTAVDKDAAKPPTPQARMEAGEAWLELAQKEKSAWRRSNLLARARFWLRQAHADATGLLRDRIDKRLGEAEETEPGAVNLLRLIDARLDAIEGDWSLEAGVLSINNRVPWARVEIPYAPPDEYELTVVFERKEGDQAVGIGLGHGPTQFSMFVDGFAERGGKSGLDHLDMTVIEKHPASVDGLYTKIGVPCTVVCTVRKSGVVVTVDGRTLVQFGGPYSRLSPSPVWRTRIPRALLLGTYESRVVFTRASLYPLSGQGKKLR